MKYKEMIESYNINYITNYNNFMKELNEKINNYKDELYFKLQGIKDGKIVDLGSIIYNSEIRSNKVYNYIKDVYNRSKDVDGISCQLYKFIDPDEEIKKETSPEGKKYNYKIIASACITNCIAIHIIELNESDETLRVCFSVDGELKKASKPLKIYVDPDDELYFNYNGIKYYLDEFIRSNY